MAVSYGFYNSVNGDRKYNAEEFGSIFDGVIRDGIYMSIGDRFAVKVAATGDAITVGTGRAWFNKTWTLNDSILTIPVLASDVLFDRLDIVVLEINTSNAVRANSIKIVQGVAATQPQEPVLTNTNEVHQYPLAVLSRKSNINTIEQADISNRVGSDKTPFVTSILESVSVEELLVQWESQWDVWFTTKTTNYQNDFNAWRNQKEVDFNGWFATLRAELDSNTAANLLNRMSYLEQLFDDLFIRNEVVGTIDDSSGNPIMDRAGGNINGRLIYTPL